MACGHIFRGSCGCPPAPEPPLLDPPGLTPAFGVPAVAVAPVGAVALEPEPAVEPLVEPEPERVVPIQNPRWGIAPGTRTPWAKRAAEEREEADYEPSLEDHLTELAQTPEGIEQINKWLSAEHARVSFAEFFRQAWLVFEPGTELVWNWHHTLMCCVVQALFMDWLKTKTQKGYINQIRNVIFNVPPGSSKSKILSLAFQAWTWLHWPATKYICLSVNDDAAMRDARDARSLIQTPWYRSTFGIDWNLKSDQDAISNFGNTKGGDRLSMAAKSEIVGLRADCLINDDPNNPKKSESKKERDEVNELWSTNQYNRVNDPLRSLRIGVQQRTNAGDWTGNAIDQQGLWSPEKPDGWLHVVLPGEFELERKFVLPLPLQELLREYLPDSEILVQDPRTNEGEVLDLVRAPKSYLDSERQRWEGTGNYAGQIQQRPTLVSGGMVKRGYFGFFRLAGGVRLDIDELDTGRPRPAHCNPVDKQPAQVIHAAQHKPGQWDFDWITISVDPASKKTEKGSNYGIICIAGKGGRRYVLDDRSQRGHLHEIVDVLRDMCKLWRPDTILIEPKAAGPDVMDSLREAMGDGSFPMVALDDSCEPGNSDKEMRLEAVLSYFKNGMVLLLDGASWLDKFVEELSLFPNGLRSDRVDAVSQCLNHIRGSEDTLPDW